VFLFITPEMLYDVSQQLDDSQVTGFHQLSAATQMFGQLAYGIRTVHNNARAQEIEHVKARVILSKADQLLPFPG
ncbi:hypothetical protein, partial [Bilophila wadsworthia]|uniref:hypothetical protein n=1 Tax=Bilophila wadsworthia TaxID=35833 RepID=UPI001EDA7E66